MTPRPADSCRRHRLSSSSLPHLPSRAGRNPVADDDSDERLAGVQIAHRAFDDHLGAGHEIEGDAVGIDVGIRGLRAGRRGGITRPTPWMDRRCLVA